MRVLYFTADDSPHDRRFLTALAETEHQVFSLRMSPCNPHIPDGITELAWPTGGPDWSCWAGWEAGQAQFAHILADLQPDLVHAGPLQGPALVSALSGCHPLVSMSWGFDLLRTAKRSPWMHHATVCALKHSDVLVADCQTVADETARYGFPREMMVLFPWGVDLNHFSPKIAAASGQTLKEALGWMDQFVVCCNRAWYPQYGVDLLAQAFADAWQHRPDLRLILAGDGSHAEQIHRILAPVSNAVHFPGWVNYEDLPGFYGAGDLFVSPSHCDGSSVSLMEALACGRPVLVSNIPSNREWVKPGAVGDLFVDGEADSLVNKLLALASDPLLDEYGQRSRALAEQRADWHVNFQKLLTAYQMALT
jgi:L-malate glycosyltransferase